MKFSSRSIIIWVAILSVGFYTFQLIKDFFESEMQGYSYYFSESALFSIIWLVFIPLTYIIWKREWCKMSKNRILMMNPILTLGHIFVYAIVIWVISGIFMNQPFIIFRNFKFGLLEYFLIISIIYFLIILLLTPDSRLQTHASLPHPHFKKSGNALAQVGTSWRPDCCAPVIPSRHSIPHHCSSGGWQNYDEARGGFSFPVWW